MGIHVILKTRSDYWNLLPCYRYIQTSNLEIQLRRSCFPETPFPVISDHENSQSFSSTSDIRNYASNSPSFQLSASHLGFLPGNTTKVKNQVSFFISRAFFCQLSSCVWKPEVRGNSRCFASTCPRRTKPTAQLIRILFMFICNLSRNVYSLPL